MSNVRDPFDLRRSPALDIIRGTTATVTQRVKEAGTKVYDTGLQAIEEMSSFSQPPNISSYATPQREMENRAWVSSGVTSRSHHSPHGPGVMSGVQDRMGSFFDKKKDLPMYKDKPYSYASSRRRKPVWQRKRVAGIAFALVIFILYLSGLFSSSTDTDKAAKSSWSFFKGNEDALTDWTDRRERVKEAFTISWDAYKQHAWGTLTMR